MSSEKIAIDGKFGGSGMTVGEAITRFKQAKDRRHILEILSDESGLTVDLIKSMFVGAGGRGGARADPRGQARGARRGARPRQ